MKTNTTKNTILGITMISLLSTSLFALTDTENLVLDFAKKQFEKSNVKPENLRVINTHHITENWDSVNIAYDIVDKSGKKHHQEESVLVSDNYMVSDAINLKDMSTLRGKLVHFDKSIYAKDHLLFGDMNAKNKIVVFSDPFCPICRDEFPKIKEKLQDKDAALFMYQIPLERLHPAAKTTILHILASKDKNAAIEKVYNAQDAKLIYQKTDFDTINKWFTKVTGEKISYNEVFSEENKKKLQQNIEFAKKLRVSGTPFIFKNGQHVLQLSL